MIQCEIPLKLNKYIYYELSKAYQERKPHILSLEVVKLPWIWKIYMEIQLHQWFNYITFADVVVITKQ